MQRSGGGKGTVEKEMQISGLGWGTTGNGIRRGDSREKGMRGRDCGGKGTRGGNCGERGVWMGLLGKGCG